MEFNMNDGELPTTVRCLIEDNDGESCQLAGNLCSCHFQMHFLL